MPILLPFRLSGSTPFGLPRRANNAGRGGLIISVVNFRALVRSTATLNPVDEIIYKVLLDEARNVTEDDPVSNLLLRL